MSLNSIIEEFEKDQSITAEQLASQLLTKENLSLKTEIPFAKEVEITAMLKDACYLAGDMFRDVKISDGKGNYVPMTFKYETQKGEKIDMSFNDYVTARLLMQLGFSEEYAVSHKRQGRKEVAGMTHDKIQQHQPQRDTLSRVLPR